MKSIALLLVVVLVACVGNSSAVEPKQVVAPKAPVQVDFKKLEAGGNDITKARLEQFRKAVEAFNAKIEGTRMNAAHKEAIKQQALERVMARMAALKRTNKQV